VLSYFRFDETLVFIHVAAIKTTIRFRIDLFVGTLAGKVESMYCKSDLQSWSALFVNRTRICEGLNSSTFDCAWVTIRKKRARCISNPSFTGWTKKVRSHYSIMAIRILK